MYKKGGGPFVMIADCGYKKEVTNDEKGSEEDLYTKTDIQFSLYRKK